jgi:hypothetical protein
VSLLERAQKNPSQFTTEHREFETMSDDLGEWTPDAIGVSREAGTNNVLISFTRDDGPPAHIKLDQVRLSTLISQLHEKIELSPQTPISLDRLRAGLSISVQGVAFSPMLNGELRLRLHALVDDRLVTIPLLLERELVDDFRKALC